MYRKLKLLNRHNVLLLALPSFGCASIGEVNPKPTIAIEEEAGPLSFELDAGVKDEIDPSAQITVTDFPQEP